MDYEDDLLHEVRRIRAAKRFAAEYHARKDSEGFIERLLPVFEWTVLAAVLAYLYL